MNKKQLLIELSNLKNKVSELEDEVSRASFCLARKNLTIEQAQKRDYIVRTNYIGKIKDPKLKKDFESFIEERMKDNLKNVQNRILNYDFWDDYNEIHILNEYHYILKEYEAKQIVLDIYGNKKV